MHKNIPLIIKKLFMKSNNVDNNLRRQFLGTIAGGVAAIGLSSIISPLSVQAKNTFLSDPDNPEKWFEQIK